MGANGSGGLKDYYVPLEGYTHQVSWCHNDNSHYIRICHNNPQPYATHRLSIAWLKDQALAGLLYCPDACPRSDSYSMFGCDMDYHNDEWQYDGGNAYSVAHSVYGASGNSQRENTLSKI